LYRTGSGELCAILRGLDGRTTGDVASVIAPPLADMVAGRSGAWSLRTAMIEPAEAVRRLAAVHWAGDASSPEPVTGSLASAV
jgi:hypothetical protein